MGVTPPTHPPGQYGTTITLLRWPHQGFTMTGTRAASACKLQLQGCVVVWLPQPTCSTWPAGNHTICHPPSEPSSGHHEPWTLLNLHTPHDKPLYSLPTKPQAAVGQVGRWLSEPAQHPCESTCCLPFKSSMPGSRLAGRCAAVLTPSSSPGGQ